MAYTFLFDGKKLTMSEYEREVLRQCINTVLADLLESRQFYHGNTETHVQFNDLSDEEQELAKRHLGNNIENTAA